MTVNSQKIILSIVECILLQADLDALGKWYNEWQLIINIVLSEFQRHFWFFRLTHYWNFLSYKVKCSCMINMLQESKCAVANTDFNVFLKGNAHAIWHYSLSYSVLYIQLLFEIINTISYQNYYLYMYIYVYIYQSTIN